MNHRRSLVRGTTAAALLALCPLTIEVHAQTSTTSGAGTGAATSSGSVGGGIGGGVGGGVGMGTAGSSLLGTTSSAQLAPTLTAGSLGGQGLAGSVAGPTGTSSGVSTTNAFSSYFGNPQGGGIGVPSANSRFGTASIGRFGAPLYNINTQIGTTGSVSVSISGVGLGSTGSFGGGQGGLNARLGPTPQFVTDFPTPATAASKLRGELSQVLARSTALTSRRQIQVDVVGNAVVLSGQVADERERRLAENLLWLSPGVSEVRNELVIR